MPNKSIASDFLAQLRVPHTAAYTDAQFAAMPFQSLYGLTKLLSSYGVATEGLRLADKSQISRLTAPFLADTPDGFVIVTSVDGDSIAYLSQGEPQKIPLSDFIAIWNGIVLLAYPDAAAKEPGYELHHIDEVADKVKRWLLLAVAAGLFIYLFVSSRLYAGWWTIGLTLVDIAGLVLSFMLVQKSLNIKNKAADKVCGVLQEGGCDKILEMKASSFFGIFKWSEVGLTYFSVSLLALLIFPSSIGALALCNACCLPFTVWSIWYQRFRAHHWCTLCVSVQASLWLLFFCYLPSMWWKSIFPLPGSVFLLGAVYLLVLLAINRVSPIFEKKTQNYETAQDNTPAA